MLAASVWLLGYLLSRMAKEALKTEKLLEREQIAKAQIYAMNKKKTEFVCLSAAVSFSLLT